MSTEPRTIVIVDDDLFLRRLYEAKLTEAGYVVKTAADGEAGLALVRQLRPALVLLDVEMPKSTGFEVLEALRADAVTANIPVILWTNSSRPEDIARAYKLGAVEYLIKVQFLPSEVLTKVKGLIG